MPSLCHLKRGLCGKSRFEKIAERLRNVYVKKHCKAKKKKMCIKRYVNELPKTKECGVYIIFDGKTNKPVYVGKSTDIRRRFMSGHLSTKGEISSSPFRKYLHEEKKVPYKNMYAYILANYTFKFLENMEYDDSGVLESILIKLWRKKGLYNNYKG